MNQPRATATSNYGWDSLGTAVPGAIPSHSRDCGPRMNPIAPGSTLSEFNHREPVPTHSCPNCGDGRSGRYCSQCGQNDRDYNSAVGPMLWELVREAFEVDSRVFRTLKLLLFKPGSLSVEFARNRRAGYMSPVRLYLFTSFAFFLVLSFALPDTMSEETTYVGMSAVQPTDVITESQLAALKAALRPGQGLKVDDLLARPFPSDSRDVVAWLAGVVSPGEPSAQGVAVPEDPNRPGLLTRAFASSVVDFLHDPDVFTQRMLGNMPLAMFFLLPFLALALAMCYAAKKRYFVIHLVFAIHVQTFVFVALGAAMLIRSGPIGSPVQLLLTIVPAVYYLIALRRFYRDSWIRTLAKGLIVTSLYLVVLLPGFLVALFLTA